MSKMNRLCNAKNQFQGPFKRVLCICSAGLLRSPTAALVLSQEPFNFNTRAAGIEDDFALVVVDDVLLEWADQIVCMQPDQKVRLEAMTDKPVFCLDIKDSFRYRDSILMDMIKDKYLALTAGEEEDDSETT